MGTLKPIKRTKPEIWKAAEEFRYRYVSPPDMIPVPINEIVEFDLKIDLEPQPGLRERCDIDGFLTSDLKSICVDNDCYFNERYDNRLRFTLAHEIGYLVLHREIIEQCSYETPEEWIRFRENLPEEDLSWFEFQAYEFAGRLLVPKKKLTEAISLLRDKINQFKSLTGKNGGDLLREYVSNAICKEFKVSPDVILRRINSERIWEELNL